MARTGNLRRHAPLRRLPKHLAPLLRRERQTHSDQQQGERGEIPPYRRRAPGSTSSTLPFGNDSRTTSPMAVVWVGLDV
jgi:hypothetical protein